MLTRLLSQAKGQFWFVDAKHQARRIPPPGTQSKEVNPHRGQKETRQCAATGCEELVTHYLTPARLDKPWFHNYKCRAAYQIEHGTFLHGTKPRRGDYIHCALPECNKKFYRQPAYVKQDRRFHTKKCAYESFKKTRKMVPCALEGCDKVTARRPSDTRKFCGRTHEALAKIKNPTGREHNGRPVIQNAQGYFLIYEPAHPSAHKHNGRILEHRWVVEQALGRYLTTTEQVDHINQNKQDNSLVNLQVMTPTDHTRKTAWDRVRKERQAIAEVKRATAEAEKWRAQAERYKADYERQFGQLDLTVA